MAKAAARAVWPDLDGAVLPSCLAERFSERLKEEAPV